MLNERRPKLHGYETAFFRLMFHLCSNGLVFPLRRNKNHEESRVYGGLASPTGHDVGTNNKAGEDRQFNFGTDSAAYLTTAMILLTA